MANKRVRRARRIITSVPWKCAMRRSDADRSWNPTQIRNTCYGSFLWQNGQSISSPSNIPSSKTRSRIAYVYIYLAHIQRVSYFLYELCHVSCFSLHVYGWDCRNSLNREEVSDKAEIVKSTPQKKEDLDVDDKKPLYKVHVFGLPTHWVTAYWLLQGNKLLTASF